ncbi:MAG: SDR family oxidoreductase [Firmicutes bacterium]|nr:SDR family oxidoreductase [Bacillota bacterium]
MDYQFQDKIAVITGAAGGIGSACVKKFYENGAKVALLDIREDLCEKTVEKLELDKERVLCLAGDLADEKQVKALVDKVLEHFGTIDFLVNTAGIQGATARIEEYEYEEMKRIMNINFFGTLLMMHYVLPIMQAKGKGSIVNFGSCSGMFGYTFEVAYGASKAAIIEITKCAAAENGINGVRINSISPGWVDTGMYREVIESYKGNGFENPLDNVNLGPMERPATPMEMANCVAFLCCDDASFVNGCNFVADGGKTIC